VSAEIAERRLAGTLGNLFAAVARKAYFASKFGGMIVLSHDIPNFVLGQQTVIGKFLVASQATAAGWFDVLAQILMKL
jgi:hypothetical protein